LVLPVISIFLPNDGCEQPYGTLTKPYIALVRMRFRPLRINYHAEASNSLQDERKETTKILISAAQKKPDDDVVMEELFGDCEEVSQTKDGIREHNTEIKERERGSTSSPCGKSEQDFGRSDVDSYVSTTDNWIPFCVLIRDESTPTNPLF
jgi:hypothetical protein